jgi:prophage regulatory protein
MYANDNAVLLSLNDVSALTSLSRTAINRLRAAGNFPAAVMLGERRVAFVRTEVLAWIESRVAARQVA